MTQVTHDQQFTIWGGNIASTMAGEFPFSISFALLPLALAVLWRVCEDGKGWRAAALLVSAVELKASGASGAGRPNASAWRSG